MFLDIDSSMKFSNEEKYLIEKAENALKGIKYLVPSKFGIYTIDALVYPSPLRLDFKAHVPGEPGQAFIAPAYGYALTEDLFDVESFTKDFLEQLNSNVEDFRSYITAE